MQPTTDLPTYLWSLKPLRRSMRRDNRFVPVRPTNRRFLLDRRAHISPLRIDIHLIYTRGYYAAPVMI